MEEKEKLTMAGDDGVQVWNLGSEGAPERLIPRILDGPGAQWIIRCIVIRAWTT